MSRDQTLQEPVNQGEECGFHHQYGDISNSKKVLGKAWHNINLSFQQSLQLQYGERVIECPRDRPEVSQEAFKVWVKDDVGLNECQQEKRKRVGSEIHFADGQDLLITQI